MVLIVLGNMEMGVTVWNYYEREMTNKLGEMGGCLELLNEEMDKMNWENTNNVGLTYLKYPSYKKFKKTVFIF